MNAVIIQQYGSPEVLTPTRVSTPLIENDEILVKVKAASLNPIDYKIRRGDLKKFIKLRFPKILGHDIAGEVAGVGPKVKNFKAGDEVYAMLSTPEMGGYGGYVAVREENVALKPKNLSFEEAAAIPLAGLTALQALRDRGKLQNRNQEVLINGASGGVGSFAVQIAKAKGAVVVGVCSTSHVEMVRQLGADAVIDYLKYDFTQLAAQYDIIFDAVGKRSFSDCRKVLYKYGRYVTTKSTPKNFILSGLTSFTHKKAAVVLTRPDGADLKLLANYAEEGLLRPVIEKIYTPEEMPRAHQRLESGHVAGKLIIKMDFHDGKG